jgi:hypothetical protein
VRPRSIRPSSPVRSAARRLLSSQSVSDRRRQRILYKFEIAKLYDKSSLVSVEEPVDFGLADWLPERDAGKHFERGCRETRAAVAAVLFTQIVSQGLVVHFGSEKRNYSVGNSWLKASKGELPVTGKQSGNEFDIAQRRHGSLDRGTEVYQGAH